VSALYRKLPARLLLCPEAGLKNPSGMVYDQHNKLLWICDMGNRRILQYEMETGRVNEIPSNCGNGSKLGIPLAIALDADHRLVVTDVEHNTVFRFNGGWEDIWPSGAVSLDFPGSITCDADRNIYIADFNNDRIVKAEPSGGISVMEDIHCKQPYGLYAHEDKLYVADTGNRRILRYHTHSGEREQDVILNGFASAISIALNNNGDIFYSENRRLFLLPHGSQEPVLLIDSKRWRDYSFARLAHIGSLSPIGQDIILISDTVQNSIYEIDIS